MLTLDLDKSEPVKSDMAGGRLREPYSFTAELFATDRFRERKGKLLLVVCQLVTPLSRQRIAPIHCAHTWHWSKKMGHKTQPKAMNLERGMVGLRVVADKDRREKREDEAERKIRIHYMQV